MTFLLIAVAARLVDDPGEPDLLAFLELDRLRERRRLAGLDVVRAALHHRQCTVLAPDLGRLARHACVVGRPVLGHGKHESIDILRHRVSPSG
jgi:hypothetical protein